MMMIEGTFDQSGDGRSDQTEGDGAIAPARPISQLGMTRQRRGSTGVASRSIYAKRHTVFDEHDAADAIYEVISGAVIITRCNGAGQRQVLEVVGPGGFAGIVSGARYGCRAETMTRTVLRKITRRAIEKSTNLQRMVGQVLTHKVEKLHEQAGMRTRMSATQSVAALILSLPKADVAADGEGDYRLALAQSDMASHLGLAIETVCRAIKNLKGIGAIRTSGREWIEVVDAEALAGFAEAGQTPSG
ncbi:protein of unknown function [Hyphomicrobium sp. 1Nfss2.1]